MVIKPRLEKRIKKGTEELNKKAVIKEKVRGKLRDCLKENGICGDIFIFDTLRNKVDYEQIRFLY